jgi:orotate phosphoribosyltransferase
MEEKLKNLALELFNIGAINFGAFKWKFHEKHPNAPLVPIYFNLRIIRSYPKTISKVVEVFEELIKRKEIKFDLLSDLPYASTPIVSIMMYKSGVPMITPRKEEKKRGIPTKIEGVFKTGQTVILVDDVLSFADSKIETANLYRERGLKVEDAVVLLAYDLGGKEKMIKHNLRLHFVYEINDLLSIYLEAGKISNEKEQEILTGLANVKNYLQRA